MPEDKQGISEFILKLLDMLRVDRGARRPTTILSTGTRTKPKL